MSNCSTFVPCKIMQLKRTWLPLDVHDLDRPKAIKTRPEMRATNDRPLGARLPIFEACLHGESHSANASLEALALGRASPAGNCDRDFLVDFMDHSGECAQNETQSFSSVSHIIQ